jgi:hypothetical protein
MLAQPSVAKVTGSGCFHEEPVNTVWLLLSLPTVLTCFLKVGGWLTMDTVDLTPFLKQKVQEWKKAQQRDPELKSLAQVGKELLDLQVLDSQHSARIAAKISSKLEGLGKKNRVESYINQMSQEERKYVSLISLLEEFTAYKGA